MVLAAIGFVALGTWFVINPSRFDRGIPLRHLLVIAAGIASILFFGLGAVVMAIKLGDKKPGLIVDAEGITDNTSLISNRFIPWADITAINVLQIGKQRLIMLHVSNPEDYIIEQGNFLKKKALQMNFNQYGTPLSITANGLKCSFDELYNLLREKLGDNKGKGL